MPGFNQTGPMGQGPMTGRRMGRCTNSGKNIENQTTTENENPCNDLSDKMSGRGLGWRRWFGFGQGQGGCGRGAGRQNRFRRDF
jgi:hypothetical protein